MSSWANRRDLEIRYGGEKIVKMATKSFYDPDIEDMIVDRSPEMINLVIQTALEDAKSILQASLGLIYSDVHLADTVLFPLIKYYHAHMTYWVLKEGTACSECDECREKFEEAIKLNSVCNDDNICLTKKVGISVTPKKHDCHCGCCELCGNGKWRGID